MKNKKVTIATTTVSIITAVYTATMLYTPRKAKAKTTKVWNNIGENIANDLGLSQVPTIKFDNNNPTSVMYVESINHYRSAGLFQRIIMKQETDYVIHVSPAAVAKQLNLLHANVLKDISEEFIMTLFRHECRHLYQIQSGMEVGKVEDTLGFEFNDLFEGHGASPTEEDANIYAITAAENEKQRLVAELAKCLQDESQKICPDKTYIKKYTKELRYLGFRKEGE